MGRPCGEKVRYRTAAKARRARTRCQNPRHGPVLHLYEYRCPECGFWHLASTWRRRLRRLSMDG